MTYDPNNPNGLNRRTGPYRSRGFSWGIGAVVIILIIIGLIAWGWWGWNGAQVTVNNAPPAAPGQATTGAASTAAAPAPAGGSPAAAPAGGR